MRTAFISLGSNIGNSEENIKVALELLQKKGVNTLKVSGFYKTEPQGDKDQPWFFNKVAMIETTMRPEELLIELQDIENTLGRLRTERRFGPRTIDIDILLFGAEAVYSETLIIPHPRMYERAFVLVPLAEIAPNLILPNGISVKATLEKLNYTLLSDKIWQES
ncbi:2-amino-4-hydroxy-6-hydroxymethyldihydropteridine diphosphokinase [Desulfovibrio sp. OttesenSCG-928-F07]|nr:2-amino-4-hydroxy-6-hydroxymethyldihydropteridine diphosphokinase [Desulfovibrio sp. OttesenSCG-928-F07]